MKKLEKSNNIFFTKKLFISFIAKLKKILFSAEEEKMLTPLEQSLYMLLTLLIIFAIGPLLIYSAIIFLSNESLLIAFFIIVFYIGFIFVILIKKIKISHKKLILILLLYSFAIFILVLTGHNGAGLVAVIVIMCLSGVILESKKILSFTLINIIVFIVLTALLYFGKFDGSPMETYKTIWIINMSTTQICGIGIMTLIHLVYKNIDNRNMELKKSKELLFQSEEKYKYIFNNSPIGKLLKFSNGEVQYNNTLCKMLGYTNEELEKIKWDDLTYIDDKNKSNEVEDLLLLDIQDIMSYEKRYVKKDGSIMWATIHTSLRKDKEGIPIYYMTSVLDITAEKKKNKERLIIEAHLRNQQKLESIGTLASGVAHEINNPINGILNYGQIILDSDIEDEDIKKFAKEIIFETNRVSKIVKNLLNFSRHNSHEHSYANIEDIIGRNLSLINTVIRHDNIQLITKVDDNLPKIKCRSQEIQQVIMNLLTNAHDSLNEKYPEYNENKIISLICKEIVYKEIAYIEIIVEDNGTGIPKKIINNIFDPFFTTKSKDKGTGLGLSISYGIIKDHKGELKVETEVGKFTRFILRLPCDI